MSAYQSAGKCDEYHTPAYIADALDVVFDLDVAAPSLGPRHIRAKRYYTQLTDGLKQPWTGFVWMNPPFGNQKTKREWLARFIEHGNGIALLPDRTSAPWFQEAAPKMDAGLFVDGKIKFERSDGSIATQPGDGTVFFAMGNRAVEILKKSGLGLLFYPIPQSQR